MKTIHIFLICLVTLFCSCDGSSKNTILKPSTSQNQGSGSGSGSGQGGGQGSGQGSGQGTGTEDPGTEDPGTTPTDPPVVTPTGNTVVVGYATYWDSVMPDPTFLTHINYAFAHIKSDYENLDVKTPSRLTNIVGLKSQNPNLKVLLSVGGWGADYFSPMAASDTHIKNFCTSCVNAVKQYKLDGIDLDWEYPTYSAKKDDGGYTQSSSDDTKNFTKLVKALRTALGTDKLLTMASASNAEYIDWASVVPYLDWVNLMTYDMGDPPYHNAALYYNQSTMVKDGKQSHYCEGSVQLHNNKGVPYEKIVLGMPFYGHGDGTNVDDYIYFNKIKYEGFTRCWDEKAQVPYLTNSSGKMVLSYDDETSVAAKAAYVKQKGLRGAMYWNIEGDDANWTLSKAIAGVLLGWVDPNAGSGSQEAFLATNQYIQKYLEEVDYTNVIPQHPYGDENARGAYSLVTNYPGGGPSENDIELPPTYTISWKASSSGSQTLTLQEGSWSRTYTLSSGVNKQAVTNLVPNTTYHWRVTSSNTVVAEGSFQTKGLLHQVFFTADVRNGRDLGGWKGLGGKTLAYHKLYRGTHVDKYKVKSNGSTSGRCDDNGRAEMLAEGIKADLDLREASDVPSSSPLGSTVAFYAPGFDSGYNHMVRDNKSKVKATFCWVVDQLRKGNPVYFHCSAGRDRTATLAVLLEGALGMSESDMAKDYELTYFSPADVCLYEDRYQHTWDNYSYTSIRKTIYGLTKSGSYSERIVDYLLQIGVPQSDIDDLRKFMLE